MTQAILGARRWPDAAARWWPVEPAPPGARFVSLDALRGLTVAAMVLVEQLGGSGYPALRHAEWNGITFTDLVFPAFLAIVGASLARSMPRSTDTALLRTGLRRAIDLIALGLVFNAWAGSGSDLSTLRYFGVLQRIGLCSLLAVVVMVAVRRRPWAVALVVLVLLVAYGQWLVHSGRGCGQSVVPQCNAAGNLDRSLVSTPHLYRGADYPGYDPEGLASTVGALATTLIGWLAMTVIIRRAASWRTVVASGLMALGLLLASLLSPLTAGVDPIKRIWTPAFALRAAAPVVALLGVMRLLDVAHGRWTLRSIAPLRALGATALVVYMGQHLLGSSLYATHIGSISAAEWVAEHWIPGSGDRQWLYYAVAMTVGWTVVAVVRQSLAAKRKEPEKPRGQAQAIRPSSTGDTSPEWHGSTRTV